MDTETDTHHPHSFLGLKLVYLYPWKDLVEEFEGQDPDDLKGYIRARLETIDKTERRWIVIIAGLGFFADAYSIFSINMVLPMLGIVYYGNNNGIILPHHEMGIVIATLSGSLVGQLFFGIFADILGRRKMYGWELVVTIFATIGVATASYGVNGSLSILGGLIAYRFILGLGIGADYPLSAVICSEFAPTANRARMLSAVFLFQPLGQLAATLVALVIIACFKSRLNKSNPLGELTTSNCYQDSDCARTVDIMWRIIIGLGAVPPVLALWFRLAILESPRYTADVLNEDVRAAAQMNYMGKKIPWNRRSLAVPKSPGSRQFPTAHATGSRGGDSGQVTARRPGEGPTLSPRRSIRSPTQIDLDNLASNDQAPYPLGIRTTGSSPWSHSLRPNGTFPDPGFSRQDKAPKLERRTLFEDLKYYYWNLGHGWTLFACCLCWFCVDLPFYGLGMNNPIYISDIWSGTDVPQPQLYKFLFGIAWQSLIIVSIGAVTGGFTTLISVNLLGERRIQMIGFFLLFVLFVIVGSSFQTLMNDGRNSAVVVLYLLCQIFFNFGPNTTTYMIPAEFFPTRFRASSHGIAAASGKFGSVIAQIVVYFISNHFGISLAPGVNYIQVWLGYLLICFSPFMFIGLMTTIYLIPKIRGGDKNPLTLEALAAEDKKVDNLMKRILRGRRGESLLTDEEERRSSNEDIRDGRPLGELDRDEIGSLQYERRQEEEDEYETRLSPRVDMERRWRSAMYGNARRDGEGGMELEDINLGDPALRGAPEV